MPNRTLCSVLEEMRKCDKTRNYSYLVGLIEEAQTLANRMEAGLWDQKDLKYLRKQIKEAKEELESIKRETDANKQIKRLLNK